MKVYIQFDLKIPYADRAQAFATIQEARPIMSGGTDYITLATGTSGLLSGVDPQELMRRAADDALRNLRGALVAACEYLTAHGLCAAISPAPGAEGVDRAGQGSP